MSRRTRSEQEERLGSWLPIWVRLPPETLAILLVILVPSLYISSMQPTGIMAIFTGIATSTLVLMVVVAAIPLLFAVVIAIRRVYDAVKQGIAMAIGRG